MKKTILTFFCFYFAALSFAQVYKTINLTAPGTLSMFLNATEQSTITNLTVTGEIDARDFVTMDKMPLLQVLDIRDCIIIAYSGLGRTYDSFPNYLANEIPLHAFDGNWHITSI